MSTFAALVAQLKSDVEAQQYAQAEQRVAELKRVMLDMDSLPPLCLPSPSAAEDQRLAQEALEYAIVLAVRTQDKSSFAKHIAMLKPYFAMSGATQHTPLSETVTGLHLLYLLVENRLADFHCQLELLADELRRTAAVQFCTQLEQHLVVGAYNQVLSAAENPPLQDFTFFLQSLLETVRQNIGECMANAYTSIAVRSATKMLMFHNDQETLDFVECFYPAWKVTDGTIFTQHETKGSKSEEIASIRLITHTLSYATELERIV